MKILCVGDIHAHEWSWWPRTDTGINEYLDRVRHLIGVTIPEVVTKYGVDQIVFLGDMAEVNKTGSVRVVVLNLMVRAFATLKQKCECGIVILRGQHDMVGGGSDWLSVFEDDRTAVVRDLSVTEGVAYIANAKPDKAAKNVEAAASAGCHVLLGHFYLTGAKADNGTDKHLTGAVPCDTKQFQRIILGDIHTPQGTERMKTIYVGSVLRYSWATKDTGPRRMAILDTATNIVQFEEYDCPSFVGPTDDLALMQTLNSGSFVRFLYDASTPNYPAMIAKQFKGLRIDPVRRDIHTPPERTIRAPEIQEAMRKAQPGSKGYRKVLEAYVAHCAKSDTALDVDSVRKVMEEISD